MRAVPVFFPLWCTLFAIPLSWAADELPRVAVISPKAGQHVSQHLEVRVKVDGKNAPQRLCVGLGKGAWTEMAQDGESGEWMAKLDSSMVPNGNQILEIFTDNREVRAATEVHVQNSLQVFFSDLHSHTSYSDGALVPSVAYAYARDTARLHVFCVSDHLEYVDDAEWLDTREASWKANHDGQFVALPGLEWTKEWGHINLYDPGVRDWPEDPGQFYKACAKARVIAKFNHPGDGTKTHGGLKYSEVGDQAVQLMEVRIPDEEKAYIRALDLGWHIAPDGSDDTHEANWGTRFAWSGILAPGLSKQNILDALAKRHCYSTLDRNCVLRFQIGDAVMGDIVEAATKIVSVRIHVDDPDQGDITSKIELFEDGQIVETKEPNSEYCQWVVENDRQPGNHYYFVKVTQKDGNQLWSAPIWVTVTE